MLVMMGGIFLSNKYRVLISEFSYIIRGNNLGQEIAMKKLFVGIIFLPLLVGCAQANNQPITSDSNENLSIIEDRTISASGLVTPAIWANVAFLTGGKDIVFLASVGQHVQQGQLLATVNEDNALINIQNAEYQLESANATLDQIEDSELASDIDIEIARIAVDIATAGVEQANLAWENTRIYSPLLGKIPEFILRLKEL
jgi:macrolide-specific efflux system membrane fusion protein